MKNLNKKVSSTILMVSTMVMMGMPAFADNSTSFSDISSPIVKLINQLLNPLLAIVGALGTLYCILLGVKYAKAEDPQEQMKAKNALKNAIIGFVLIFVLIVALRVALPILTTWVNDSTNSIASASLK